MKATLAQAVDKGKILKEEPHKKWNNGLPGTRGLPRVGDDRPDTLYTGRGVSYAPCACIVYISKYYMYIYVYGMYILYYGMDVFFYYYPLFMSFFVRYYSFLIVLLLLVPFSSLGTSKSWI